MGMGQKVKIEPEKPPGFGHGSTSNHQKNGPQVLAAMLSLTRAAHLGIPVFGAPAKSWSFFFSSWIPLGSEKRWAGRFFRRVPRFGWFSRGKKQERHRWGVPQEVDTHKLVLGILLVSLQTAGDANWYWSRATFPILSRDPSFQETTQNPGKQIRFLINNDG